MSDLSVREPDALAESAELSLSLETPDEARRLLALPVGLHEEVPERVYHARVLGMASKSALDQLRRSAAHYRAWVAGLIDKTSSGFAMGKATHLAVLEPERFGRAYVIAPDFGDCRKKENKQARDSWTREHSHAMVLKNAEGHAVLGMIRSLAAHPLVAALFARGVSELTCRWDDPETGLACKSRLDHYRADLATVVDLKAFEDASPSAFARHVWNYGYHRQDAFYREGVRVLGGDVRHFVFVCVEKTPPHAIALYELDVDAVARGDEDNELSRRRLAECIEKDEWPSYGPHIQTVSLPPWAKDRHER